MTVDSKAKLKPPSSDLCLVPREVLAQLIANQRPRVEPLTILCIGITPGGFSQAVATLLADEGHTVIAVDANRPLGVEAVRQVRARTGSRKVFFLWADAALEQDVRRLETCIRKHFPRLDAVVNVMPGDRDSFVRLVDHLRRRRRRTAA